MLITEACVETSATIEAVWSLWADPNSWPDWDPDIVTVEFRGEFVEGALGTLVPVKGPRSGWRLQTVEPGRRFVTTTRLPGAKVVFDHTLDGPDGSRVISHRITMTGFAAPLLGRVIGPRLAPQLAEAVANVAAMAEATDGD